MVDQRASKRHATVPLSNREYAASSSSSQVVSEEDRRPASAKQSRTKLPPISTLAKLSPCRPYLAGNRRCNSPAYRFRSGLHDLSPYKILNLIWRWSCASLKALVEFQALTVRPQPLRPSASCSPFALNIPANRLRELFALNAIHQYCIPISCRTFASRISNSSHSRLAEKQLVSRPSWRWLNSGSSLMWESVGGAAAAAAAAAVASMVAPICYMFA